MRLCWLGSWLGLLAMAAFGQSTETRWAFEASDVRVSPKVRQAFRRGPLLRGDRYEVRQATMLDLISEAYGKDPEAVWGGPSWLEMTRFDIVAQMPAKSTVEARQAMLQSLLADRFKLVVHDDRKPMPAFAL